MNPETPNAENTATKQRKKRVFGKPFQPGQSGNPEGRPKGARNKFGEHFVLQFFEHWAEHGKAALDDVAVNDRQTYLRTACTILPKVVEFDEETKGILAAVAGAQIDFQKIKDKLDK